MRYYVDYFDFYLGGIGHRMVLKNKEQRLKFDILCIDPLQDILVFTLSETLLEDSNRILIQYDDFWKNGIFKIALAKKYKNLHDYIKERLDILNFAGMREDNFESDIYSSKITFCFIDEYLGDKLNLKKGNRYIIYRTTNADLNNRTLLKNRIYNSENIYNEMKKTLNYNTFNKLIDDLLNRSNDKTQIFQREYILQDMFMKYPNINTNRKFLYNLFDQNYNDAMALSVDAVRISKTTYRINGDILFDFLFYMDKTLCKKINSLSSHQIFLLINNISWQKFIEKINDLYIFLYEFKKISQGYNMYHYIKWRTDLLTYASNYLVIIMDWIVGKIGIIEPYWRIQYELLKYDVENFIGTHFRQADYTLYIASEIIKRKESIMTLVEDIICEG